MGKPFYHALKVVSEACTGCTHCMNVCPTAAIRIKYGKAVINEAACTDCGMCLKSCPRRAIIVEQDDFSQIFKFSNRVILLPTVFIGQFPDDISEEQIFAELHNIGFTYVMEVDKAVPMIISESEKFMELNKHKHPFISAFCPAVIRLIQVRFPSLIDNIIRLKQAMDLSAIYARKKFIDKGIPEEEIGVFYVTQCAAKIAAIKSPVGEDKSPVDGVINMDFIYNKVLLSINKNKNNPVEKVPEQYHLTPESIQWTLSGGESSNFKGRCLAIDEIHNVIDILEKLENDELNDIDFIELRACDHSCAGGALATNNRFLTIERLNKRMEDYVKNNYTSVNKMPKYKDFLIPQMQLTGEIMPRSIEKLDEDFTVAMQKMEQINKIMKILPQVDCGFCGTPSCKSLAKDVVMGKAKLSQCIFKQKMLTKDELISPEESQEIAAKIWGEDKFENHK
ncbi:MAG: 4Fe-4S binding protein [Culturomica sp.]|jgi:Na+-translocating ferredoxin:NAD+ oxidoreductase RNF subunit RnfB|nr:4Fe-4S binding protein [Culturomica sp.]